MGALAARAPVGAHHAPSEEWIARRPMPRPKEVTGAPYLAGLALAPDGRHVYVAGMEGGLTGADYGAAAFDAATGELRWSRAYDPGRSLEYVTHMALSPDGARLFVTGWSGSSIWTWDSHTVTVAFDAATGDVLWEARVPGYRDMPSKPAGLGVSPDGSTVFVLAEESFRVYGRRILTIAYDAASGGERWRYVFGGEGTPYPYSSHPTGLAVDPSGATVYFTGSTYSRVTDFDAVVAALSASDGSARWVSVQDGMGYSDRKRSPVVSTDGATLFLYSYTGTDPEGGEASLVALDAGTGAERWRRPQSYGRLMVDHDRLYEFRGDVIALDPADGSLIWDSPSCCYGIAAAALSPDRSRLYVTGAEFELIGQTNDMVTIALDVRDGKQEWKAVYNGYDRPINVMEHRHYPPGTGDNIGRGVAVSPDGTRVYVTGESPALHGGIEWTTIAYRVGCDYGSQTGLLSYNLHITGEALAGPARPYAANASCRAASRGW